jgi:hypothetical protein
VARSIDYGNLMHRAMRGLIQEVLADVAAHGLPGKHHFFITFDTQHPDVEIADWLSDRYPGEMTIVLQHWFADLDAAEEGFSVTLNFGDNPEPLYIPYDAIKTFVDPSVEFGLRFETQGAAAAAPAEPDTPPPSGGKPKDEQPKPERGAAEVVSLDKFRK